VAFEHGDRRIEVGLRGGTGPAEATVDGVVEAVRVWAATPDEVELEARGARRTYAVHQVGATVHVDSGLGAVALSVVERFPVPVVEAAPGSLVAPMPGAVVALAVRPGETVEAGETLVTLEAMKMEHAVRAPAAGTVADVRVAVGDQVETGDVLVVLDLGDAP
jgi:biotin carboxyl carrier protein